MADFEKKPISGFYYDQQLATPLMSISLHPNQVIKGVDKDENNAPIWGDVDDPDDDEYGDGARKYSKTAIAVSILNEDFSFDIANQWSDFDGDAIGQMWNQQRAMGPYLAEAVNALERITESTNNWLEEKKKDNSFDNNWGTKLVKGVEWLARKIKKGAEEQNKYLSRALVVKGTRFSYYGGTGISVGNLAMKFTILPTYDTNGRFVTVYDQLKKLLPYVIGEFISVKTKVDAEVDRFIAEFASWQLPPGGFEADLHNVDIVQKGTLKLRLGSYYYIDNLVIGSCQFTMSKQLVKNPKIRENDPRRYSPLYCDVSLTLRPASKYSKNSLDKFINGKNKFHAEYVNEINESLSTQEDATAVILSKLK